VQGGIKMNKKLITKICLVITIIGVYFFYNPLKERYFYNHSLYEKRFCYEDHINAQGDNGGEYAGFEEHCYYQTKNECEWHRLKSYNNRTLAKHCYSKIVTINESKNTICSMANTKEECHKMIDDAFGQYMNSTTNNVPKKVVDTKSDTTCTKYKAYPNQQEIFGRLGLDWERTKKWGAFVDMEGTLRANKPSCREIPRISEEYIKYQKK
jgi:hypothetical protein